MKVQTTSKIGIKGFKLFNNDWTCNSFRNRKQYSCPGKFEEDVDINIYNNRMQLFENLINVFNYNNFNPTSKVAEVIAYGNVIRIRDSLWTDKLEIIREIPYEEIIQLVNTGKYNKGRYNSGMWNAGNWNTGDLNSGNYNSGDKNDGDWNTGDGNIGTGNDGDWNTGYRNIGDCNNGDWNISSFDSGCFNTTEPKIRIFNKPSEISYHDWCNSDAYIILRKMPYNISWIKTSDMSDEEKNKYPSYKINRGYLKILDKIESHQQWWNNLSDDHKSIIKAIPNFDAEIFKQITGITVD